MKNDDDGKRFLPWLCGMFSLLLFYGNSAKVSFVDYINFNIYSNYRIYDYGIEKYAFYTSLVQKHFSMHEEQKIR